MLEQPEEYWDRRHRTADVLQSGGHIGLPDHQNEAFYRRRAGDLLRLAGDRVPRTLAPLALDAGCGQGLFAEAMVESGWDVIGIDTSPTAVAAATARVDAQFEVSSLSTWAGPLVALAYVVDVLFHVLDDGEWARSLDNVADHVGLGGLLVLTELDVDEDVTVGDYIVHRARRRYDERLSVRGLRHVATVPYDFLDNGIAFRAFARVA